MKVAAIPGDKGNRLSGSPTADIEYDGELFGEPVTGFVVVE